MLRFVVSAAVTTKLDTHYLECPIDIPSVMNGQNKRLTVMLRNVPNRYTEVDLKRVLDLVIPSETLREYFICRWLSNC